jgi:hypothetical protein
MMSTDSPLHTSTAVRADSNETRKQLDTMELAAPVLPLPVGDCEPVGRLAAVDVAMAGFANTDEELDWKSVLVNEDAFGCDEVVDCIAVLVCVGMVLDGVGVSEGEILVLGVLPLLTCPLMLLLLLLLLLLLFAFPTIH